MRGLVTGASGYIGGSVAAALGWAPHRRSLLDDIEHGSYNEAA